MTNDFKNLIDMLGELEELDRLRRLGLTEEEVVGYLEFFATNKIKPLNTVMCED